MTNEDKWKISTNQKMWEIDFYECSKCVLVRPSYGKDKQTKKCEDIYFNDCFIKNCEPLFT